MSLLGSLGGVLWGSQAKAGLVNSSPKEQGFGKLCWCLIYGMHRNDHIFFEILAIEKWGYGTSRYNWEICIIA